MMAAMVAGMGASLYTQVQGAKMQEDAAKFEAKQMSAQAKQVDLQAKREALQSRERAVGIKEALKRSLAEQQAAFGGSGLISGFGDGTSAANFMRTSSEDAAADIKTNKLNSLTAQQQIKGQAAQLRGQAAQTRYGGRMARFAGLGQAAGSAAGMAQTIYSMQPR